MTFTLGSLFDGSGGFPLAGALCNIVPIWASEIEPYPIAVTKSRFPGMKHLHQQHARKYHSYFGVFEKKNPKLEKIKPFQQMKSNN